MNMFSVSLFEAKKKVRPEQDIVSMDRGCKSANFLNLKELLAKALSPRASDLQKLWIHSAYTRPLISTNLDKNWNQREVQPELGDSHWSLPIF